MKRVIKISIVFIVTLLMFGLVGCENKKDYTSNAEKIMKDYATTYYNEHMVGIDTDVAEINIKMLQDFNDLAAKPEYNADGMTTYDLSKISKCTQDSYVDLVVDADSKEIQSYNFHLTCD